MILTEEQNKKLDDICKSHFVLKECALGTTSCPLNSVCILPNTAFPGETLEEQTAEFERQLWALAEKV